MDLFPAPSTGGSLVDVSDRVGRLLGIVSTAQLPAALVGGRLDVNIGAPATLPVSLAAAVDVSDRVGRLLGHVTIDAPVATPASSGVSNASGVRASAFNLAFDATAGTWGAWRQPPTGGGSLPDGTGGPVGIPGVALMLYDVFAGNWKPANATTADGQTMSGPVALNLGWNGAGWDRLTSTIANGLDVDVTRVTQLPAALVGGRLDVNIGAPATLPVSLAATVGVTSSQTTPADALANTAGLPTVDQVEGWNGATWDRLRAGADNADGLAAVTAGILRVRSELSMLNGAGTWDRAPGDTTQGLQVGLKRTTLTITVAGGANAIATATLPAAGAGLFHYITHIRIARVATAALAGGAILTVTTTNLPGARAWRCGNTMAIVAPATGYDVLVDADYVHPIKSSAANTNTTIVGPAAGAAVSWDMVVDYYTGP